MQQVTMTADSLMRMLAENMKTNQTRPEMSLEDINAEIAAYRTERKELTEGGTE